MMSNDSILKRLKKKLSNNSPGLTVAVVALIFALTGGAFAAGGGLTSKQKKQVKSIAQTEAKKFAAAGPAGPAGSPGVNGTNGKDGAPGADGTDGKDGDSVTGAAIAAGGVCGVGITGVKYTLAATSTNICTGAKGANGTNGQDAGFNYLFSTDTGETDPGTGKLKLDNAAPGSATVLRISQTDNNANLLQAVIANWASGPSTKGTLLIRKAGAPATFAQYTVKGGNTCASPPALGSPCAIIEENTYDKINITFVAGNGSFANNDPVTVAYFAGGSEFLPSGAIETGTWAFTGTESDVGGIRVPLSFPVRLAVPFTSGEQVHFQSDEDFETFCFGSVANPRPEPGQLCVYDSIEAPLSGTTFEGIFNPNSVIATGEEGGAGRAGAILLFSTPTEPVAAGAGVFAVRAP